MDKNCNGIDECLSNLSKAQIPLMEWLANEDLAPCNLDRKYKMVKEQAERLDSMITKIISENN